MEDKGWERERRWREEKGKGWKEERGREKRDRNRREVEKEEGGEGEEWGKGEAFGSHSKCLLVLRFFHIKYILFVNV